MSNKVKGADLLATLKRVEEGETFDIFNLLPEVASGQVWLTEIKYTAQSITDYIQENEEYDLDALRDFGHEYADGQCADTYYNINKEVQELSLWASNDVEADVQELGTPNEEMSLTTLNSLYLYSAKRITFDAVADQAFQNTEEASE